jgi:hypothetical protein
MLDRHDADAGRQPLGAADLVIEADRPAQPQQGAAHPEPAERQGQASGQQQHWKAQHAQHQGPKRKTEIER